MFVSQTSVLDFFTSTSRTHASPPGLLHVPENDTDDLPTVQEEVPSACIVTCFVIFCYFGKYFESTAFFFFLD